MLTIEQSWSPAPRNNRDRPLRLLILSSCHEALRLWLKDMLGFRTVVSGCECCRYEIRRGAIEEFENENKRIETMLGRKRDGCRMK